MSPARDVWPGRDGSPGQDVSPGRDVSSGTLRAHSFTRQLEELRSESWSLFPYKVPAISFVSSLRGRMPPCLRSHATDPSFPHAASRSVRSFPRKFNRFIMTIVHIHSSTVCKRDFVTLGRRDSDEEPRAYSSVY